MNSPQTGIRLGRVVDRLGSAVLFVLVAYGYFVVAAGDSRLHREGMLGAIELVALPLAALAAGTLRWGVEAINAPRPRHSLWPPLLGTAALCAVMWWLLVGAAALLVIPLAAVATGVLRELARGPGASVPRAIDQPRDNNTPWLPWLGAAVAFAVIYYLAWSWLPPQTPVGSGQFGLARWLGTALLTGVGYLGMIFFPRLTASLAGAVGGPALVAIAGYILSPLAVQGPEGRLADILALASLVGALVAVTAMPIVIALSEPFRRRPLTYAVWAGLLTFCMAVQGTFNGTYPGQ